MFLEYEYTDAETRLEQLNVVYSSQSFHCISYLVKQQYIKHQETKEKWEGCSHSTTLAQT
jgi:hypothetical protein